MNDSERVPVIVLQDTSGKSYISLEIAQKDNETIRTYAAQCGPRRSPSQWDIRQLESVLFDLGITRIFLEDIRKSLISGILKRTGFRKRAEIYEPRRQYYVSWPSLKDPMPSEDSKMFGVADDISLEMSHNNRRMLLRNRNGAVGEIFFTDYGRFARCKANQFAVEGFGRTFYGNDPSLVLQTLCRELKQERKKYLIFGSEFREYSEAIHPFPLWHMVLANLSDFEHVCRTATAPDIPNIAKLTAEYEDSDRKTAMAGVSERFSTPKFRYILSQEKEGFALIKFLEGAEGMLHDLYISPSHQGKGIGDELVRASISQLSESCIRIHLNTIYPRAKRLYEKYDFKTEYTDHCVPLSQKMLFRQEK